VRLLARLLTVAVILGLIPAGEPLAAQSSLFGVRGLGTPGRPLMPGSIATGGSFGLFDGESDLNPAAVADLSTVTAQFILAPSWRHWETPAGTASLRGTRFPLFNVGGPIPGSRFALGLSFGSYADRDFRLATHDTITLREVQVPVYDTLTSLGGLNEVRLAAAYRASPSTTLGAAFYVITGSSRLTAHRAFGDSTYTELQQSSELAYRGVGVSVGVTHRLSSAIEVAALIRSDGKATVDRDSSRVYSVDLPYTFGAAIRIHPSSRLAVAGSGLYRTWSAANSDLLQQGGVGARNTLELGLGGEYIRDTRRPSTLPIRFGVRYAQLPFPLSVGGKPSEVSVAVGTANRFAQDRAGIEITLEHAWRKQGSAYKERAFSLTFGLSIRPYGAARSR
jgi:hypothetical protein